jgi:tetratricopeptide (TPR) repeat protein
MKTVLYWIAVIVLGVAGLRGASAPAQVTKPASATADQQSDLVDVPQPDLSTVDSPVQEQIKNAQAALAAVMARASPSIAEKAEAFGTLGEIYQAYEFDDAAIACYANASKLQPQAFRWPYYAGYLHQRTGDSEAAERDLRQALSANPKNVSAMLRLGNVELSLNHTDLAKSWFLKASSSQGSSAAAAYGMGKVALIEHQYSAAVKYFKEALVQEPHASSIHYQLAMAYRGLGDMQHMQEQLQLRGEAEPAIKDPYLEEINLLKQGKVGLLERGSKAVREGRFEDAVATYRQMVNLYPSDPIARTYLGVALAKSGRREEALEQYAEALRINPDNPKVHYDMGILLIDTHKEDEAIAQFREAVRIDPGLEAAHFQVANLLMRQRKDDEAGREYGIVVSLEPQNGFARLMQAMAAVHAGSYSRARSILEDASTVLPKDPDIANALARLLAAAPDGAVRDGHRALNIIGNLVQHQQGEPLEDGITLAMALAAVGRFQEAATYQAAIIQQLEQSRRPDLARSLRRNLALYQQGKPCRVPWPKDDPIFTPVPSNTELPVDAKSARAHP